MFSVEGKVTVITGAASGVGKAASERFSRAGATVILADVQDGSEVAAAIGGTYMRTDVSNEDDVHALMTATAERFGRIDVCINNAGIFGGVGPFESSLYEDLEEAYRVNAIGPFLGMKHAVPHMPRGSAIVNTASLASVIGFPSYAAYTASKWAVVGLTKTAAIEYGPKGIRVNCICPSTINTPMLFNSDVAEEEAALCRVSSSLDAVCEPEDIAAVMHFLATDESSKITGTSIIVDGGITAGFSLANSDAIMRSVGLAT
jgi:3alpha(or 20beta)-hydroxysteroid dehydrogenase